MTPRPKVLVAAIAALSLLVPASASAGTIFDNDYEGRIESNRSTYFGFDVQRQNGKVKVARVTAMMTYHCAGSLSFNAAARVNGKLRVKNRRFAGTLRGNLQVSRGDPIQTKFRLKGKLGKRGRARGTIDAVARIPMVTPVRGPEPQLVRCYSGGLDWKAKRGADVSVPVP